MEQPSLRFKTDDGSEFPAWEEKKFGDIWKRIVVKNDGSFGGDKIISVANMKWAPKDDVRDDYLKTYNLLPLNAIAFEGNRNNSYSYGRFVLNDIGEGIVSHVFVCFEPIADIIPAFWKEYIHAECVMGKILRKCTKSSTMMHDLVVPDFLKQIIFVPSLPEQRKIADLLSAVDDVIAAQEAEVAAWEKRKKGVMQKLFSQEVRFKADDGSDFPDWEEKTLGDICMYERQRSEGANFVGTENMLKDFGGVTFDNSNADGSGTLYHPGDTLMSNIRPYLKKAWLADRKGTCSTDVLVFHPTSVEPGYLYWLIASDAFVRYVMSAAKGSKMPRGDKKHIMEMPLLLPNKDEQRKIDDCLSSLNDVIIKAKNELAKWQELKKGLLQQMFV